MKNAFWVGLGLGFGAGMYLMKHCHSVREVYDIAEDTAKEKMECAKEKINEVKDDLNKKKQKTYEQTMG